MAEPIRASDEHAASAKAAEPSSLPPVRDDAVSGNDAGEGGAASNQSQQNTFSQRKRKGDFGNGGHRGGRGGKHGSKRNKNGDMGRGEYFSSQLDRRQRNEEANAKRQREGPVPGQGIQFSKEEIAAEERRPKRKVAVMIGYSGTGYKGMQISGTERTIEGDLFQAFIKAGAISKANAEDPKKSSLVRCARTDKGVHAAGNMISLKLIVEDKDIVEKINAELSPQIRIWGIERVIASFSCCQAVDSRWYEYLIPSHAFLPPHPGSWLAKQLEKLADDANDRAQYEDRQGDAKDFWARVEESEIKPLLETIDDDLRSDILAAIQGEEEANATSDATTTEPGQKADARADEPHSQQAGDISEASVADSSKNDDSDVTATDQSRPSVGAERVVRLRAASKQLRNAYTQAKRRYRISPARVARIQAALDKYVGTKNYHNFTIQKSYKDPSAKRHIKSFVVNPKPILIGEGPDEQKTEWLSLKVHGQSFMMHQIRKMVGMVTLVVRSGADLSTMDDSFTETRFAIPKVPGLGLLLERPVFDSYNTVQAAQYGREPLLFDKYNEQIEEFKQREIYQRIFREEEEKNEFGRFFNHIDNFKEPWFLYVSSMGHKAAQAPGKQQSMKDLEGSDDEGEPRDS